MGAKIGTGTSTVNTIPEDPVARPLTLAVAVLALVLWVTFAFILSVGTGAVHLLLALGVTLIVRWIALGGDTGEARPGTRETVK